MIAITMPASTKTTMSTCIQIQNGDTGGSYPSAPAGGAP